MSSPSVDVIQPPAPSGSIVPADEASGDQGGNAAWVLAQWTRISPEIAKVLYDGLRGRRRQLVESKAAFGRLAEFQWIADQRLKLIMALCQAAAEGLALAEYCLAITGHEEAEGRPAIERDEIEARIGYPGEPHAVVERARGLIPRKLFRVLDKLSEAVGYVQVSSGVRRDLVGTAFLIKPDVVITSAHVAFQSKVDGASITTSPPARKNMWVCFPETPAGKQEAKLLLPNPVLAYSEAHLIGVDQLDRQVSQMAASRLDFALLRLDRAIEQVVPIDISGDDVQEDGRLSFLIGYPQRTEPAWDADPIVRCEPVSSRIIHMLNSLKGMSGGCVVGNDGIAIGIHEGSIPRTRPDGKPHPTDVENRAVLLKAISDYLKTHFPGCLEAHDRPIGLIMHDEALVTRLGRRGAQLLADRKSQAQWETVAAALTQAGPTGPWTAHPWFTDRSRARIQDWFAIAASTDTKKRVAFINGPRGSGKTFMIDVLKRTVRDPASDLIRVTWTESETTLQTLARQFIALPDVSGTRTADGHVRYENVPGIVSGLSRYGLDAAAPPGRPRPLFIAIDAGDELGSPTEPKTWIELVVALSREPWARVVLCGLPVALKRDVEDAIPREVECDPFDIQHVRSSDIVLFLERFGMAPEATKTPKAAAAVFDSADMPHKARPELTTCMAALFAIGWHRGILPVRSEGSP